MALSFASTPTFNTPLQLGGIELKNRVIMSPMTRDRTTLDLVPTTDRDAESSMLLYYEQRASAGELSLESCKPTIRADAAAIRYEHLALDTCVDDVPHRDVSG